jgi:hypothetical protein
MKLIGLVKGLAASAVLASGMAHANYVVVGLGAGPAQQAQSVIQFQALLNNQNVSAGGAWAIQNGILNFVDDGVLNNENDFVNQLRGFNQNNRTLLVGANVPRVLFGAWGPHPLMNNLIQAALGAGANPLGVQVIDMADFARLRPNTQAEPLLDIIASVLIHELAEVGFDGPNFNPAHGQGILSQNQLLGAPPLPGAPPRSNGQRGAGGRDLVDQNGNLVGFDVDWIDTARGIQGFERILVRANIQNARPFWVAPRTYSLTWRVISSCRSRLRLPWSVWPWLP